MAAFHSAGGFGVGSFETEIVAVALQSTGLEVRDQSLFATDVSAVGLDFLIFDPGEVTKKPFDQGPNLPSREDFPFDLDDEQAWIDFYAQDVLAFLKGRWLGDEA